MGEGGEGGERASERANDRGVSPARSRSRSKIFLPGWRRVGRKRETERNTSPSGGLPPVGEGKGVRALIIIINNDIDVD